MIERGVLVCGWIQYGPFISLWIDPHYKSQCAKQKCIKVDFLIILSFDDFIRLCWFWFFFLYSILLVLFLFISRHRKRKVLVQFIWDESDTRPRKWHTNDTNELSIYAIACVKNTSHSVYSADMILVSSVPIFDSIGSSGFSLSFRTKRICYGGWSTCRTREPTAGTSAGILSCGFVYCYAIKSKCTEILWDNSIKTEQKKIRELKLEFR